jgi:hypothetical protein
MPATDQDLRDAQLRLLDAETEVARSRITADVARLAADILNDRAGTSGRTNAQLESSAKDAVALYKAVGVELRKPDLWGPAA